MRRRFADEILIAVLKYLLALFLFLSAAASGATTLTPHAAEYRVKISVLGGELNTRLVADGNRYAANHVIHPTGLSRIAASGTIDETSEFTLEADRVVPRAYRSVDELTKDKTRADVVFDWQQLELDGEINGEPAEQAISEDLHDRVSIQYQLMHDLQNDALRHQYRLFDIDEIKVLNVTQVGTREIRTPAGTFDAIGIRHQAEGSSRTTTLWCVGELDYLPVVIEQHRKGKLRLRATLKHYRELSDGE